MNGVTRAMDRTCHPCHPTPLTLRAITGGFSGDHLLQFDSEHPYPLVEARSCGMPEPRLGRKPVLAIERASAHLQRCRLCEHRCEANRLAGERGPCRAGAVARVYRHRVEYGEELELTPSHVFYLSGCDLRCVFCIAEADAFDPGRGEPLTGEFLRRAIPQGRERGARNIQWLGGESTIHLPQILAAMSECREVPPVVWKSNFHMTPEVFELLEGVANVYVADFKFGSDDCSRQLAGIDGYFDIVTRNLRLAREQPADLIVRHLVMPGHRECCTGPIIDWTARHLRGVKFSLRGGYVPAWQASRMPGLGRYLAPHEFEAAMAMARSARLNLIE